MMELKIPRFVVEAVFPNLAFNDAALSAAIRVDQAVLRYDVARETFIIRGGMKMSLLPYRSPAPHLPVYL